MKFALFATLFSAATMALPSAEQAEAKRDGAAKAGDNKFDPDFGFKKRDGAAKAGDNKFDPDFGFKKRDGAVKAGDNKFDPDFGF